MENSSFLYFVGFHFEGRGKGLFYYGRVLFEEDMKIGNCCFR